MGLQIVAEGAPCAPFVVQLRAARFAATYLSASIETRQFIGRIPGAVIGSRCERAGLLSGTRPTAYTHLDATYIDRGLQVEDII